MSEDYYLISSDWKKKTATKINPHRDSNLQTLYWPFSKNICIATKPFELLEQRYK